MAFLMFCLRRSAWRFCSNRNLDSFHSPGNLFDLIFFLYDSESFSALLPFGARGCLDGVSVYIFVRSFKIMSLCMYAASITLNR